MTGNTYTSIPVVTVGEQSPQVPHVVWVIATDIYCIVLGFSIRVVIEDR